MERILISTYQQVILWDGKTQRIILKGHEHQGYTTYYGITWNEEHIIISESGEARYSTYHMLDGNLERVGELPIGQGISDPHQIYWWNDKLYIASADQDKIVIWDGETCRDVSWNKPGEPRKHVNSIWCDGERFYVVEHRYREMPKWIRIFDLDFEPVDCIELTIRGFVKRPRGIHNVYIEDGILYGCAPKAMYKYDVSSGEHTCIPIGNLAKAAHRIHGLARVPGKFFIGLTRIVEVRSDRGKGNSAVLVLNDDFVPMGKLLLRDVGGINDIRAVDGPDLAHNGIRCPFQ